MSERGSRHRLVHSGGGLLPTDHVRLMPPVGTPIVKAMVVVRRPRDEAILVSGDTDDDGSGYERPPGGHVEPGELAIETARRELREEIGQELQNMRLLDVMENLFRLNGVQGHEIVFVLVIAHCPRAVSSSCCRKSGETSSDRNRSTGRSAFGGRGRVEL